VQIVRERKAILRDIELVCGRDNFTYEAIPSEEYDQWSELESHGYTYVHLSSIRQFLGDESCVELSVPKLVGAKLIDRIENAFPEAELYVGTAYKYDVTAFRDSLYKPADIREKNVGTIFKTGLPASDPNAE
jgi:hypothetical protein